MNKHTFNIYFDEAGRWPLAGPLYIWLVCTLKNISKNDFELFWDSKKFSESKREKLYLEIEKLQKEWKILTTVAWITAVEIDKYWMTNALHCAILRWMYKFFCNLFKKSNYDEILPNPLSTKIKPKINYTDIQNYFLTLKSKWVNINLFLDGNSDFWLKKTFPFWNIKTIVSWDAKIKEIWIASIIAKVSRDHIMENVSKKYLKYNFKKHKWYGTKEHRELIKKYWPSDIHRKLFLKHLFPNHSFKKVLPSKF